MRDHEKQIPIWIFIGALLALYGVLIFGSGIYGALNPPPEDQRVALWHFHADIWWGALVCLFGLIYTVKFWPREGEGLTGKQ
jgi:hypothetical protein